jgi:hypothetical protein
VVKLPEDLLQNAFAAVEHHGFGDFFPEPPEWRIAREHWASIKPILADLDLDTFAGYDRIPAFAPKSRLNVRRVALLHPYDLLLYTALVLGLRDAVSRSRLAADQQRVFSYRAEGCTDDQLYSSMPGFSDFRKAISDRFKSGGGYVGITDVADFYPRIYQHRLVNAPQAAATQSDLDRIRVLEKMLFRLSDGTSYGIPIGPPASRILGEAVLIDVDSTLLSNGIDFVRFSDDYVIFASRPEDADYGIRVLGETLFLNHGLTLQTAKTKVMPGSVYLERFLTSHSEKEETRRQLIEIIGGYDGNLSYDDLDEEAKNQIDALNLSDMLSDALAEGYDVDYREVSFILGRLSALQMPDLIPIVLKNLELLSPVAHSVVAFFREFDNLDQSTRNSIAEKVLSPIIDGTRFSEYYAIWILHLFTHSRDWNHLETILRIFRETHSDVIRRYAALALRTCGDRAAALIVARYLQAASPLCRTAILLATSRMGFDERRFLKRSLRLTDSFEKVCLDQI